MVDLEREDARQHLHAVIGGARRGRIFGAPCPNRRLYSLRAVELARRQIAEVIGDPASHGPQLRRVDSARFL